MGKVQFTPEAYNIGTDTLSYGRILFPDVADDDLKEFNRTILSIILYYYIKNNEYEKFVAAQNEDIKLTREKFSELREFILSNIDTEEKERLLIYYLVINDLGKSQKIVDEFASKGIRSIDHDSILRYLVLEGMLPSWGDIDPKSQNSIINILKYGVNVGQIIQGECTSYSLKSLENLDKSDVNLMLIEALLDIAGVLGHINQNGSAILNQHLCDNFLLICKIISSSENPRQVFNKFLEIRAKELGIECEDEKVRQAIVRICLMIGINNRRDAMVVMNYIISKNREYNVLIEELCTTGYEGEKAILLYYSPALLRNVMSYYKTQNEETALESTLEIVLPFFQKAYIEVRKSIESHENGSVTVMLRDVALLAAKNPEVLETIQVEHLGGGEYAIRGDCKTL